MSFEDDLCRIIEKHRLGEVSGLSASLIAQHLAVCAQAFLAAAERGRPGKPAAAGRAVPGIQQRVEAAVNDNPGVMSRGDVETLLGETVPGWVLPRLAEYKRIQRMGLNLYKRFDVPRPANGPEGGDTAAVGRVASPDADKSPAADTAAEVDEPPDYPALLDEICLVVGSSPQAWSRAELTEKLGKDIPSWALPYLADTHRIIRVSGGKYRDRRLSLSEQF